MKREPFRVEILPELVAAIGELVKRAGPFNMPEHEVVELCLYQGITKTRATVERMERERAANRAPSPLYV